MTTPQNNGGPITPSMVMRQQVAPDTFAESRMDAEGGMTLRDYFAAAALQGMMANPSWDSNLPHSVAENAYGYANAMLAARQEVQP